MPERLRHDGVEEKITGRAAVGNAGSEMQADAQIAPSQLSLSNTLALKTADGKTFPELMVELTNAMSATEMQRRLAEVAAINAHAALDGELRLHGYCGSYPHMEYEMRTPERLRNPERQWILQELDRKCVGYAPPHGKLEDLPQLRQKGLKGETDAHLKQLLAEQGADAAIKAA